jgi:hypothetical protein
MTTPDIAGLCERLEAMREWHDRSRDRETITLSKATLERQAAERDALRLAILGGEDVPGVAATVSIDQCIRFLTEERQRNEWSAEQQAKLERQAAEIERLRGVVEWYGEQARLARLAHAEGDKGRNALAADGGKRARAALTGEGHD